MLLGAGLGRCAAAGTRRRRRARIARRARARQGHALRQRHRHLGQRHAHQVALPRRGATARSWQRECGVLVCENETKWQSLRPKPGEFRFAQADEMFAWAQRTQHAGARPHADLAAAQVVAQVGERIRLRRPAGEGGRAHAHRAREHRVQAFRHHRLQLRRGERGGRSQGWRCFARTSSRSAWARIEQLDLMFRLAHEHAPHAQLVYNDYMSWGDGYAKHRAGVLKLLREFRKRGTPVHALGLQSHIGSTEDGTEPTSGDAYERDWRKFLDEVTGMRYELLITEFDVHDRHFPADYRRARCRGRRARQALPRPHALLSARAHADDLGHGRFRELAAGSLPARGWPSEAALPLRRRLSRQAVARRRSPRRSAPCRRAPPTSAASKRAVCPISSSPRDAASTSASSIGCSAQSFTRPWSSMWRTVSSSMSAAFPPGDGPRRATALAQL